MLGRLFSSGGAAKADDKFVPKAPSGPRVARHSGGWATVRKALNNAECTTVLDIGPTSSSNINFLTEKGCSVYMADPLHDLATGDWQQPDQPVDAEKFLDDSLKIAGRRFELVLLWDALDYLPEELLQPMVDRLAAAMEPGGVLLAYFHTAIEGAEAHRRFHVGDKDEVEGQSGTGYTLRRTLQNRQVEKLFAAFSSSKLVLARDKFREAVFTR